MLDLNSMAWRRLGHHPGTESPWRAGAREKIVACGFNIVQDAEPSVASGMSEEAVAAVGISEILPLARIAGRVL
ncbi:hypothetical protein [Burkholderia ubonensis]|uniref:hypothetical protein n=1 Tax=Burkholderia ubonensis TaxID=101571 RepID=UPI0007561766|nr:hypothetical protein [Burkholderia ubonensis]KWB79394.1 hypothetical protein WL42_12595 [Burkholderia ubonensis]